MPPGPARRRRLGDRLQREREVVVSGDEDLAVRGRKADGEGLLLRPRDLRSMIADTRLVVAFDLVIVQRQVSPIQFLKSPVYPGSDLLAGYNESSCREIPWARPSLPDDRSLRYIFERVALWLAGDQTL